MKQLTEVESEHLRRTFIAFVKEQSERFNISEFDVLPHIFAELLQYVYDIAFNDGKSEGGDLLNGEKREEESPKET